MAHQIDQAELIDRLAGHAAQQNIDHCSCTIVLGSGFSYPIVPTTSEIVRDALPWFVWCQTSEKGGPSARDFADQEVRAKFSDPLKTYAQTFWKLIHDWARRQSSARAGEHAFALDEEGMPARSDIAKAYLSAFSTACPHGLATEEAARRFLAAIIRQSGTRLNPAHLYLASLMRERPSLFRTVFTTNFDPLLQRSLQLVNMPYFVSDRPDVMQHPDDDAVVEAIHLVHVHGSIYRYLLLNTPEDIESFADRNKQLFQEYFRKHAVLIVGYGGWDDALFRALETVDRFSHNLYWCDIGASIELSGISERGRKLLRTKRNAFYVPIKGADDFMVALHQRLTQHALPRLFREPIQVIKEQLQTCDLRGMKVPRASDTSDDGGKGGGGGTMTPKPGQNSVADALAPRNDTSSDPLDLGDQVTFTLTRLDDAQRSMTGASTQPTTAVLNELIAKATDAYFGPTPSESLSPIESILTLMPNDNSDRSLWQIRRGFVHGRAGRPDQAIADYTEVIQLPGTPAELVAKALFNRAATHGKAGRLELAIADYTAIIQLPGAPAELVAKALANRGFANGQTGLHDQEIADYTAVIQLPGTPAEQVGRALVNRGFAHGQNGRYDQEIADYTAVIQLTGMPVDVLARALFNRAVTHGQTGRSEQAIADYTAVIRLPGVPAEMVAEALVNRGVANHRAGRSDQALADYTAVTQLSGAPAEQVAKALVNRGATHEQTGRSEQALADFTAVIQLPGATAEEVAKALVSRGVAHHRAGRSEQAIADYSAVIQRPGVPAEVVESAQSRMAELQRTSRPRGDAGGLSVS